MIREDHVRFCEGPRVQLPRPTHPDRKAFEDALRVRDRAIEATSVGVVIADAQVQGNPNIYVNPALSRITGYSREELLRQNMRLLQGPDTDPSAVEQIRQAIKSGGSCEVVLKNYRKGGAPFWNELLISPVLDDTRKVTHYIGIQTRAVQRSLLGLLANVNEAF